MRRMVGVVVGFAVLVAAGTGMAGDPPLGGARIGAVEGEALVRLDEQGGWRSAPLHLPLLPGDRLQVEATGRLEILFSNGAALRLGPGGVARLAAVPQAEPEAGTTAEVDLESGAAIVRTGPGERTRPALTLNSSGTRIWVFPRSDVRAEAIGPDASEVTLREGAAAVDTLGGGIPLRIGEALQVGRGEAVLVSARPPDALDLWSEARVRFLAAGPGAASSVPVPAPLAPHAAELGRHGQWVSVPEYGPVWRPTPMPPGWAPFTAGQWLWRGGTWVWLPVEPWGWIPYHYGRWRWDPVLAWYWVPPHSREIAWCPGAVAWIRTPTSVAWIPLAPGEAYLAPQPYGIWSAPLPPRTPVNVTNVTVIRKIYVNAVAPTPIVVVPATSFGMATVVSPAGTRAQPAGLARNPPIGAVTPAALAPGRAGGPPAVRPDPAPPVFGPLGTVGIVQPTAPVPPTRSMAPRVPTSVPQGTNRPTAAAAATPPTARENARMPGEGRRPGQEASPAAHPVAPAGPGFTPSIRVAAPQPPGKAPEQPATSARQAPTAPPAHSGGSVEAQGRERSTQERQRSHRAGRDRQPARDPDGLPGRTPPPPSWRTPPGFTMQRGRHPDPPPRPQPGPPFAGSADSPRRLDHLHQPGAPAAEGKSPRAAPEREARRRER